MRKFVLANLTKEKLIDEVIRLEQLVKAHDERNAARQKRLQLAFTVAGMMIALVGLFLTIWQMAD